MVHLYGMLPIRKVAPNKVALTSYYGKVFVTRGKRNSDSYTNWLQNQVMARAISKEDSHITNPICDNVFDSTLAAPRAYTSVSMSIKSCIVNGYQVSFDHKEVIKTYPPAVIKQYEKLGSLVIGEMPGIGYLVLDPHGSVFHTTPKGLEPLGSLEEFLGVDVRNAPVEYATAGVFGKDIPVGIILGLELGFEKLIKLLNVPVRRVEAGTRLNLTAHEYALSFSDESLVFPKEHEFAALILGGFNEYAKTLKLFSVYSFDKRGVYINLLEANGIQSRFVREIDLANKMFVDPITKDILIAMKEPITYQGLLFRSCQMLMTDQHPDELDPAYMRIRGYERFAGAIYSELIQSLRVHGSSLGKANTGVTMNPYAVWKRISEDPAKVQISEINPIASLKESEAVTYGGTGGRSRLSMTKRTRGFHRNDMGTISEATVDNSDVGVNIYTTANPNFNSVLGTSTRFDYKDLKPSTLFSTSAMLAVGSDSDDLRRVNFVSIQAQHAIACDGYKQFPVRTGYDSVVAHRTTDLYAYTAKKPGVVRQITDVGIIVDYDDGETGGYTLGRRFGNSQGLTVAHHVVTPLQARDRVAVGDPIVYNTGFFEPDFFDPKQIVWKNAISARTVLWESTQTHEDSSQISVRLAQKLSTNVTKVKTVVLSFDQTVNELVKVGDHVVADSVLCIIEDAVTANNRLFNAQSLQTLRAIGAQTPRAHVKGVVEKIEVYYHGDKEDMSDSLRALCEASDAELKHRAHSVAKQAYTGSVDGGYRIENNALALDSLAVKIYITHPVTMSNGDKLVVANQLKSCVGEVMEKTLYSESGEQIDCGFGYRGVEARIVNSPIAIGTTASLLKVISRKAAAIYRGTEK